jgi:hypothetical protein
MHWEFITSNLALEILLLLLGAIGALGGKLVHRHIRWKRATDVLDRLGQHVHRAVLSTYQTYVRSIREGREDGVLTNAEKDRAKQLAVEAAKSYCGWDDLVWILGLDGANSAIDDSVEETVALLKHWELMPATKGDEQRITVPLPPPMGPMGSSSLRS